MAGFGCRLLAFDVFPRIDLPATYVAKPEQLLAESDILSLHVPLPAGDLGTSSTRKPSRR